MQLMQHRFAAGERMANMTRFRQSRYREVE
jgi:hypothetical protein